MKPDLHIEAIEERYLIYGRMEILALLNELIYRGEPVNVYFGTGEYMETRLLEAREQTVVFEASSDAQANLRLAAANETRFLAYPEGIQMLFISGQAESLSWDGSAAFSVTLPNKLARLQRQESLRTIVPLPQAPTVTLYGRDDAVLGQWPLRDLSVGGLGVALPTRDALERVAGVIRVRVAIADYAGIDCSVSVRHTTGLAQPVDEFGYRIGLGFIDLPEPMRVAILRYIVDVERERRTAPPDNQAED